MALSGSSPSVPRFGIAIAFLSGAPIIRHFAQWSILDEDFIDPSVARPLAVEVVPVVATDSA
jgi:hypothetical protein